MLMHAHLVCSCILVCGCMIEWSHMLTCMLACIGCMPNMQLCIASAYAHVAYLVHISWLHCIGMYALPLDQVIEVGPLCLIMCIAFHLISKCILGFLGHHALKCAIGGPRIENHVPLSLKHDRGCVGAHICLKCIAMPCFVLCCCQNRILQEALAGRPSILPTDQIWMAESPTNGRWLSCYGWWSTMSGECSLRIVLFSE